MSCWGQIDSKLCFWKIWVEYKCFWKTFHLILMHSIHKILCFEEFLHKIALFFKNFVFPDFQSIESVSRPIEIAIKNFGLNLPTRLAFDRCSIDWNWKISVFKYLTRFFFMHHLCLGFTCIALIFFVSIVQFCSHICHCFHT